MPLALPSRTLALGLALAAACAAPSAQDLTPQFDAYLAAAHHAGRFDGTVVVADGDEVIYERGVGLADRSWGVANAPDTRFRIASLTKQFTAALVLQLVEAGDLDLDAAVTRVLPDYPAAQGDRVTVHHLLSQTSGIPEHLGLPGFDDMKRRPYAPDSFLAVFSGLPLDFEPGSRFAYSNSNYYLLGVLIEHVTGQPFAVALRERLLAPLGLADTGYDDGAAVIDRMASGYTRVGSGYQHATYLDPSVPYAAGMMYSTARDLVAWTRALHRGEPFARAETLERMTTPVHDGYAYGLGVSMLPLGAAPVRAIGHSGGIFGFSTFLLYFPDADRTVAVVANTEDRTQPIALALAQILYGQEVEAPTQPVGRALEALVKAEGVEAAVARYRQIRETEADAYDLGEDQLNGLGYLLLGRGDVAAAVRLFELNVEVYPASWNPHDSLGEAYLAAGDRDRAVASYRRALALNPTSESSRDALERMGADIPDTAVRVPAEVLARYVGRYALQPGMDIEITLDGETLFAEPTGRTPAELIPTSQTQFVTPGDDARVTFVSEDGGPASRILVTLGGRDMTAPRVE